MAYGIGIEVWGDRALFSRPELSVERMSYDCVTPSAARGILESVYWHPGMTYRIDSIAVLNPIHFSTIRINEVKSKALASAMKTSIVNKGPLPYINAKQDIQQRTTTYLTNVRYVIKAHFDLIPDKMEEDDSEGKFISIIRRRLAKGQCFRQPYLGISEFPASFKLFDEEDSLRGSYSDVEEKDLGLMLYDMDYSDHSDITPMFFRAIMRYGIIDVAGSEVLR